MKLPAITDLVKGDKIAHFDYYRDGVLYYKIDDFSFPIPSEDTQGATFKSQEKPIFMMRWIRKFLNELSKGE